MAILHVNEYTKPSLAGSVQVVNSRRMVLKSRFDPVCVPSAMLVVTQDASERCHPNIPEQLSMSRDASIPE